MLFGRPELILELILDGRRLVTDDVVITSQSSHDEDKSRFVGNHLRFERRLRLRIGTVRGGTGKLEKADALRTETGCLAGNARRRGQVVRRAEGERVALSIALEVLHTLLDGSGDEKLAVLVDEQLRTDAGHHAQCERSVRNGAVRDTRVLEVVLERARHQHLGRVVKTGSLDHDVDTERSPNAVCHLHWVSPFEFSCTTYGDAVRLNISDGTREGLSNAITA